MIPRLMFHDVAALRFSPIVTMKRTDGCPFSCRDLVLVDRDGNEFSVGLFAESAAALRVAGDHPLPSAPTVPPTSHSAPGRKAEAPCK